MTPTTIGLVAGTLTSIAAIPQVIKTLKTRHVRDISIWQPLLLAFGVALWMVYGILINDLPLDFGQYYTSDLQCRFDRHEN